MTLNTFMSVTWENSQSFFNPIFWSFVPTFIPFFWGFFRSFWAISRIFVNFFSCYISLIISELYIILKFCLDYSKKFYYICCNSCSFLYYIKVKV